MDTVRISDVTERVVGGDLDLPVEAVPETVVPTGGREEPEAVLLTGATGFLGGCLLMDLLRTRPWRVYCLVRGQDAATARGRLQEVLAAHQGTGAEAARVSAVRGALGRPRLGLSAEDYGELAATVGTVYHCAANVDLVSRYSAQREANVTGTVDVLAFAARAGGVPVHHVSTLAVLQRRAQDGPAGPFGEDEPLPDPMPFGYGQGKFVGEVLVGEAARRGLPVAVYRPGIILPSPRGDVPPGDWFMRLTEASVRAGCFPAHPFRLPVATVDRTSRMIAELSLVAPARGDVFHVIEPELLELEEYFGRMAGLGFPMVPVPHARWVAAVSELPGVRRSTVLLAERLPRIIPLSARGPTWVTSERTHRLLPRLGPPPPFDDRYVHRMLEGLLGRERISGRSTPGTTPLRSAPGVATADRPASGRFGEDGRVSDHGTAPLGGSRAAAGRGRASRDASDAVAVIGVGMRLPGGTDDLDSLWTVLDEGRDLVGPIPADRFDTSRFTVEGPPRPGKAYTSEGGFLTDVSAFDAEFFGMSPREAAMVDPQQRLVLECAIEALDDAGVDRATLAGSDTAVFMGASSAEWGELQQMNLASFNAYTMTGRVASNIANRVSYVLDLHGPSLALDTACSSALTAVHHACESLRSGRSSLALAGGVNVLITPGAFVGFSQAHMLSPTGRCHPFSAKADGYVRAEGAGVLLLKPLTAALEDGDRVHAVIAATGTNSDGHTTGLSFPSTRAQAELLEQVYRAAGIGPSELSYIEAHGTGTQVGDPAECDALGRVLGTRRHGVPLPVGSVKSNLGHLEAAAGVAGLLKAILVLRERRIPRTLHSTPLNPAIDFAGLGLEPVASARPLPAPGIRGDVVGVNSFGFGGANAHAVLRTPPAGAAADPLPEGVTAAPLIVSARTPQALDEAVARWSGWLDSSPGPDFHDTAWTSCRRTRHPHRAAVIASDAAQASSALRTLAGGARPGAPVPDRVAARAVAVPRGRIAFVFAGNASQWAGMGRELLTSPRAPAFREEVAAVSAVMEPMLGWSVREELAGTVRDWGLTEVAQPLLFALQAGLVAELAARGVHPSAVVGHSVGEVAAAYCAGALDRASACRLIVARSLAQARTAGLGRMAVVGLGASQTRLRLARPGASGALEIAGINSEQDVTVTGPGAALAEFGELLWAEGVAFRDLGLDYAFHSAAMESAEPVFRSRVAGLAAAATRIPMVSTVTGEPVDGRSLATAYWWRNVREPVRFSAAVEGLMDAQGCDVMVEIGPRPVLGGYLRRIAAARPVAVVPTLTRTEPASTALDTALARLLACGARLDESALFPRRGSVVTLPAYPWQRERHWNGAPSWWNGGGGQDEEPGDTASLPLCGHRSPGPVPSWTGRLDPDRVPWLTDHRLADDVVVPSAAYVDLALASGQQAHGAPVELKALAIGPALAVSVGETGVAPWLATTVESTGTVRVASREGADGEWTEHAHGRIAPLLRPQPQAVDLPALRARIATAVDPADLYSGLERSGLRYGPRFRTLTDIRVGQDEALARYRATTAGDPGHVAHPALLDAALQATWSLQDPSQRRVPYLLAAVDEVRCWKPLPSEGLAHLRLVERTARQTTWDLTVTDASGQVHLEAFGCRMRRFDAAAPTAAPVLTEVLRAAPLPTARPEPAGLPAPSALLAAAGAELAAADRQRRREPDPLVARSHTLALAAHHTARAVRELLPGHDRFTIDDLLAAGVDAKYRRQLAVLLAESARHGLLASRDSTHWRLDGTPDPQRALASALEATPQNAGCLLVHTVVGRHTAELLTGRIDAQELLFGEADLLAARYYDGLLSAAHRHRLASVVLDRAFADRPADRPLRVLEVGAGTGSLTAELLPHLPPERTAYTYTDISPYFFPAARRRFGDHDFVEYRTLDLDADPAEQGFAPRSFDLITASNGLHPAKDLRATLHRLARLLADGGHLLAVENHDLALLASVFGFLDSFWTATDRDLRPDGPLLTRERWLDLLSDCGFTGAVLLDGPSDHDAPESSAFLTALAPRRSRPAADAPPAPADGRRVVVDFDSGLLPRVRTALAADGEPAGDDPARWSRVIAGTTELVLLCGPSDTRDAAGTTRTAVSRLTALSALAAACRELPRGHVPRIHLAAVEKPTSGLPAATGANAALWGALRVLANEQPGLSVRRIVLTPDAVERLAAEIGTAGDEDEIVLTAHGRFVPRLLPRRPRPRRAEAYRLVQDGSDRRFDWHPGRVPEPGPGEALVEVAAAALNYRDVMAATGLVPPASAEGDLRLGRECAGTVTAVGREVTAVAVGTRVACMTDGALASHVVVPAAELIVLPDHLGFADAATIPVVSITVDHSLGRVARLRAGETVLVHSAAGGIGLAALRYAGRTGARVIATAGTPAKRDLLLDLGVPHVFDSHSTHFADQVLDATDGTGVDVVLNSLAGQAVLRGLTLLKPYGRFVELGKRDFLADRALPSGVFLPNTSFHGVDASTFTPGMRAGYARRLGTQLADGTLTALPHHRYPAARINEAFTAMWHSRHVGKIVITFDQAPPVAPPTVPRPLDPTAEYLVTGGHTGFGAATALHLAARGARHLVLVGRRGSATPEAPALLADLRRQGVQVTSHAADAADPAALRRILAELDARGRRLAGVVHSTMVLDDAPADRITAQQAHAVLTPKLTAGLLLDRLTRERDLDMFLAYSSVAATLGNRHQAAYAAANAAMEAVMADRRKAGLPGLAVQWGPISDRGYVHRAARTAELENLGLTAMTAADALASLDRVRESADTAVLAIAGFRPEPLRHHLPTITAPRTAALLPDEDENTGATDLRDLLADDDEETARTRTEEALAALLAQVLATTPEHLDRGASFADLGVDSLMATELAVRIHQSLGVDIPSEELLRVDSLAVLAERTRAQLSADSEGSAVGE